MSQSNKQNELQGLMVIMASFSHGLEEVIGRGAKSIVFRAGQNVGLKTSVKEKSSDPVEAVGQVQKALVEKGIAWQVDPWKPSDQADFVYDKDGKKAMKVVCRNCMIRCSLFRYSHQQQKSLCFINQGEFCGIFKKITGYRSTLEIIHAGENACLKELVWSE